MAVKCEITTNPDGSLNLEIDPKDIVAEYERQLALEWTFLLFPIPLLFFRPKQIWRLKKQIREYKKANCL